MDQTSALMQILITRIAGGVRVKLRSTSMAINNILLLLDQEQRIISEQPGDRDSFLTNTTGCLIADSKNLQWAFYRYHISDPVYFKSDCKVTIQQIGGNTKDIVIGLQKQNVDLIPVTVHQAPLMIHIYKKDSIVNLEDPSLPNAWTNFYRSDDLAATSYFYLDSPKSDLPDLQPLQIRTFNLQKIRSALPNLRDLAGKFDFFSRRSADLRDYFREYRFINRQHI